MLDFAILTDYMFGYNMNLSIVIGVTLLIKIFMVDAIYWTEKLQQFQDRLSLEGISVRVQIIMFFFVFFCELMKYSYF